MKRFPPGFPLTDAIRSAGSISVYEQFREQAGCRGDKIALEWTGGSRSYRDLLHRIDRLTGVLRARGIGYGDRIALLSENRFESIELILAAARIGAIVACQNWRLTTAEQQHCVDQVAPALLVHSPAQQTATDALGRASIPRLVFGQA
ncbi:MAG: AMP-binding protein [Gammaproteobacteria bacterium]|nr:AMP-binding protein [Gammaproteobacteria bacterium]